MEENPDDQELINDVFRAAHSLKGAAGAIGFQSLAELTHAAGSSSRREPTSTRY